MNKIEELLISLENAALLYGIELEKVKHIDNREPDKRDEALKNVTDTRFEVKMKLLKLLRK